MSYPIVAIVGRPNVGKSTLFNRIVGSRVSIVEDTPGVTRDRIYQQTEWLDRGFTLIDTGGIVEVSIGGSMEHKIRHQAELAMNEADLILFVVDFRTGIMPDDWIVADILRKVSKPVILVANKVEDFSQTHLLSEFYSLGLGEPIPVSAAHGMNTGDLLDEIVANLPVHSKTAEEDGIRVAFIGRPNVGKSSLVNYILGADRSIVSDIPGTTRDAIDTLVEKDGQKYILIDTAGIRRKTKIGDATERYSVIRSLRAIDRAQVALILIDAMEGVTEQDKRIAGLAHETGKACVIVVNKWDLVEKDGKTMQNFERELRDALGFMSYAPSVYVSAITGQRIERLLKLIDHVDEESVKRLGTGILNDYLEEIVFLNPPPTDKGKHLRFYYMTQVGVRPPKFVVFVNRPKQIHFSYQRYIENKFREAFGFEGNPIRFVFKERAKGGKR